MLTTPAIGALLILVGIVLFVVDLHVIGHGLLTSEGWVFVHGERWRTLRAFAAEEPDPRDGEPMVRVGRRVRVVGFGEVGVVQVVAIGLPGSGRELDRPG